jgi:predicted enzyme related to lactoylglutathione lyase
MTIKTSYQPGEPIWVDLSTPDMDKSIAFYGSLFGWTCDRSRSEEFGGYSNFSKDGKLVAGIMPIMQEGMPPVWSCYVCSDDAEKTTARVTEAGGSVVAPPMAVADLGVMAVFTAPDGAFFGIWEPKAHLGSERVDEEGCPSWIENTTRDQAAVLPFYEKVFGWGARVQPGYTEFQHGGTSIAGLMDMPEMAPDFVPSYWMPYFRAEDPKSKGDEAVSLGASIVVEHQKMENVEFVILNDPNGSMFGLLRVNA